MRRFAALYNSNTNTWSVIFKDDGEEEWYIECPDASTQETARHIADALNRDTVARG